MAELQFLPALAAFVAVVLFLVKRRRTVHKGLSSVLCTRTSFKAASFPSSYSFLSPLASEAAGCARACSELALLPRDKPHCKRDPDIWVDDEIISVHPRESSDTE